MKILGNLLSCFSGKDKAKVVSGAVEVNEPIADWLLQSSKESRSEVKAKARRRSKKRARWLLEDDIETQNLTT